MTCRKLAPAFLVLSLLSACGDSDIAKVAKSLAVIAHSVKTLQTTVITANNQGLISTDDTRAILKVCVTVNQAGVTATDITREIYKRMEAEQRSDLNIIERSQLSLIMQPLVVGIQSAVANNVITIKDEKTRTYVQTALLGLQTTVNTIDLILAARR